MDVASYDEEGAIALEAAVNAAKALPSDGWLQRLVEGAPFGPIEALLSEVRGTAYARANKGQLLDFAQLKAGASHVASN